MKYPFNRKGRTLNIGVVGISVWNNDCQAGGRGMGQMLTLAEMPDVRIVATCDIRKDTAERGADEVVKKGQSFRPTVYEDADEFLKHPDMEAVMVCTSWETHVAIAIKALRAGKKVAMEVGGANSVEELWELIHAAEETKMPLMFLENCCYDERMMAILRAAREGLFGEIVHCGGSYAHDLRVEIGYGDRSQHYRLAHFLHRNAELYPTHELGPIAKMLDIGRGNAIVSVSSFASKARGLSAWFDKNRKEDLAGTPVREGDVVTTMLQCANGETIHLTHECTLPRPYSRAALVQGTKGMWQEDGERVYFEDIHDGKPCDRAKLGHCWENEKVYLKKCQHPLWKAYHKFGMHGGHGGMDYLCLRAWVESVQNNTPPPIDVYDAAIWMAVTPLSEQSIALGGAPVPMPDFTGGAWLRRTRRDLGPYSTETIPE